MVMPTLIFFGLGFGIFTVGGVSLLMAVNQESQAGTYLALWSVIQLISRGAGIACGRHRARRRASRSRAATAPRTQPCSSSKAAGLFVSIWLLAAGGRGRVRVEGRVGADVLAAAD